MAKKAAKKTVEAAAGKPKTERSDPLTGEPMGESSEGHLFIDDDTPSEVKTMVDRLRKATKDKTKATAEWETARDNAIASMLKNGVDAIAFKQDGRRYVLETRYAIKSETIERES